MKIFVYLIVSLSAKSFIVATNYYVAVSYGNDTNNGLSVSSPFKTIGKAASIMSTGDVCYIRQGRYHETISIDNLDGSSSSPVVHIPSFINQRLSLHIASSKRSATKASISFFMCMGCIPNWR